MKTLYEASALFVLGLRLRGEEMRKSLELKQKATKVFEQGKAILAKIETEKRDPTAEEHASVKEFGAQYDDLMEKSAEAERWENREAHRSNSPGAPAPGASDEDEEEEGGEQKEDRPARKVFHSLGNQLQAIYALATRRVPRTAQFENVEQAGNMLQAAASGANESVDSEGGHLVERDISSVIERRMTEEGKLIPYLDFITVSGNGLVEKYINETSRARGSHGGSIRMYWVGEGDAITPSMVKFDKRSVDLGKLVGAAYFTEELMEDAPAITGIYTREFAKELTFEVEDAAIEGDGNADKPLGIIGHAGTISVAKASGQAADTFITRNISDMWVRRHSGGNYVWFINSELGPQLDELSLPAGTAALEPRFVTYDAQGILRIKGRPVIELEYCSAPGDVGDVILADFPNGYRAIRKGGAKSAMSMHVRFLNDEQTFRITYRCGGQPKDKVPVTPFKGTLTKSNFITLAAR